MWISNFLSLSLMLFGAGCSSLSQQPTSVVVENGEIRSIEGSRNISGVYPHLTTYSHGRAAGDYGSGKECGIGAITIWGDKLYMVNYAAHSPHGSDHKLYTIDKDLKMNIFEGSVGGTPAARMIHAESKQLLMGHYLIDESGNIRVIPIEKMPGRITAIARHLSDPENMVYYYDMEGQLYEANIHTLEPKLLYSNPLPGWHGKGGYTAQGRLVLANNGENLRRENTKWWKVDHAGMTGEECNGILAEYDGSKFSVVERRQYTDVTTKNGVAAIPNDNSPLWAMGWDKRSIRLKVLEDGKWSTYLLPKAAYNNDPSHGWFTEWPRIREIGGGEMMMDMHGMFYKFPSTFSAENNAGIRPISSHLRYIPDFCSWGDKLILATDESSIQGNPLTGQPQSNLWIGDKSEMSDWGPRSGYGAIYINDEVKKGDTSAPYLFEGFDNRMAHIYNHSSHPMNLDIQLDREGNGKWSFYENIVVRPNSYHSIIFSTDERAEWLRIVSKSSGNITFALHYTTNDFADGKESEELFAGIAKIGEKDAIAGKLFANGKNFNLSYFGDGEQGEDYELNSYDFTFAKGVNDSAAKISLNTKVYHTYIDVEVPQDYVVPADSMHYLWSVDEASVILDTHKGRFRLPKGSSEYDNYQQTRAVREIESERELANIHGTLYELPLYRIGYEPLYSMMRPVASHNLYIEDYTTWNGLVVLSGISRDAKPSNHIYRSKDGGAAVWCGGVDDLWKLGKPVGKGGVWYNSAVEANVMSDKYLMTGYDKKRLTLTADKDCNINLWLTVNHYLDTPMLYECFELRGGETMSYNFPAGFSAHWAQLESDTNCNITAEFEYR